MPKSLDQVSTDQMRKRLDRISANYIESTANIISGLILDEIGEDGHAVANKLWRIANHLRSRNESKQNFPSASDSGEDKQ